MSVVRAYILARLAADQERLRSLVASPDIAVVGEGSSPDAMLETRPDVAILANDDLPAGAHGHQLPRLVIWTDDVNTAARVRSRGLASWGVIGRGAPAAQLRAAVLAVAHGLCVVPPDAVAAVIGDAVSETVDDEGDDPLALQEPLTAREREVLEIASRGLSNREVGAALGISEHTVKFHLAAIYAKLGVSTRTAAVRRGLRRGLIAI